MSRETQHKVSGFTLVELMIVVAIIGLLAAIAIPAFSRYVRKARTSEAVGYLNKEWAGSLMYYEAEHTVSAGRVLTKEFPGPTAGWASTTDCGCLLGTFCPPNNGIWNSDLVWQALSFSIPDPHHYMPGYSSVGTGSQSKFTAYARGDLNCNHVIAEFARQGEINTLGDVTGSQLPIVINELE